MTNDKLLAFLQSTGGIGPRQAAEIAAEFTPRSVRKAHFLLRAGRVSDEYLFLDQGVMRAFAHTPAGHEVTTGFFAEGQVVFEVASFFLQQPAQEDIQALTDCAGWCLTHARMNALFHARDEFREFGRALLVRGFAALKTRMLATITEPAAVCYEALLRDSPAVLQHAPLRHVASYLGITDTSLSRLRKEAARRQASPLAAAKDNSQQA